MVLEAILSFGKFKIFHPGGNIGTKFIKIKERMHKAPKIPLSDKKTNMKDMLLCHLKQKWHVSFMKVMVQN